MIYATTISIGAGAVKEIFTELGITAGRYLVTLQGANQVMQITQDSTGTSVGPSVPTAEAGLTAGDVSLQFITDKDPVYVKCIGAGAGALLVMLSAA